MTAGANELASASAPIPDWVAAIEAAVGNQGIITDEAAIATMTQSWRDNWTSRAALVVQPADTGEVQAVMRICAEAQVPVVVQGGNTGLAGAGIPGPDGNELLLSMRRLNRVRSIDADNGTMVVEAGCILSEVKDAAHAIGRLFPLSLGAEGSCMIGGNVATNAGGINALRYGQMRDLVAGLEVVLADGRLWSGLKGLRKDNAGYDLKQLFIGSEGTLGIVTAATLKLSPLPKVSTSVFVGVPSPAAALSWFRRLEGRFDEHLSACELIERLCLEVTRNHIVGMLDPLAEPHPWYVLAEIAGSEEHEKVVDAIGEIFIDAMEAGEVLDGVIASSLEQAGALWRFRESISDAQRQEGVSFKHDISVPVSKVPEFIERAITALTAAFPGIRSFAFGHLGDGNIHFNPLQAADEPAANWIGRTRAVNRIVHDIVIELGGSITAEHGIGRLRRDDLAHYTPAIDLELMARIKRALDPDSLLNPGKVLP